MRTPVGFVPFGAVVVMDCGCAAYRLAGAPNGAVTLLVIRSCLEHDSKELRVVPPRESVRPYAASADDDC
jgi:hypothetical protein